MEKSKDKQNLRPKYNLWQTTAYMIKTAWKKQKSVLVLCLVMAFLEVLLNLVNLFTVPVILQKIECSASLETLVETIFAFVLTLIFLTALKEYVSSNTLFGRIAVRIYIMRCVNNKLAVTSYPYTEDAEKLKQLEKAYMAVNTNSDAAEAIWHTLSDLLKNSICFVIYLYFLKSLNWALIMLVIITTIAGYLINTRIYEWNYRHREEEGFYSRKLNYVCRQAESIELAKDIRIFGMTSWLNEIYKGVSSLYQDFMVRREKVFIWADFLDVVLSLLRNGIAYFYLIFITLKDGMPVSQFLIYFTAFSGFTSWITGILSGFTKLHKQSMDLSNLCEYLEAPELFLFDGGEPLNADLCRSCQIELKNVSFRYPGSSQYILKNLNLTIHAGEKLAVVGLNGAGKTTLVKLICGFYEPTEGEILLNGQNIKNYNRRDYYALFSAVFQEASVLDLSIKENIAQSVEHFDLEKMEKVVQHAGLEKKIKELPKGYETHIGKKIYEDGIELSGGEMQRLLLARALYKDAPVMVLDEPTAALDALAEEEIYQKYDAFAFQKTAIYISHRLASTRFCDRIILLENGNIAEEGTHESLLKTKGRYADLFQIQGQYYAERSDDHEKKAEA